MKATSTKTRIETIIHEDDVKKCLENAEKLKAEFLLLAEKDAEVFSEVMEAYKLPHETDQEKADRNQAVEEATKRTLEPIYEAVFENSSYGYRPGRSQHQCLDVLGRTIQQRKISHVVEADIKSFSTESIMSG